MFYKIFILALLFHTNQIVLTKPNNIQYLTEVFFSNLQKDPYIQGKNRSVALEEYVDKKVKNYVHLIKESNSILQKSHVKRSLTTPIDNIKKFTEDPYGTYQLDSFSLESKEKTYGVDTHIFKHCVNNTNIFYLAILQANSPNEYASELVINMYQPYSKTVGRVNVVNGTRLGSITVKDSTFIVVAEYKNISEDFENKTAIYEFRSQDGLRKIQNLDVEYVSDAIFWLANNNLYLAIASEKTYSNGKVSYSTESSIYMWMGKHFDIVNQITTYSPKMLTAFQIGSFNFLAVANYKNDHGETEIYSDIYRYDMNDEKFVLHQRLLTVGAIDIKYFCFTKGFEKESFLIVSSSLYSNTSNSQIMNTIIYKYIEDYFIPFQGFNIKGVIEWVPIVGRKGEFALLVNSLNSSLRTFGYDGWKFVETKVHKEFISDNNPIQSISSYTHNDETTAHLVISIPEKQDIDLYYIYFVHKNPLREYQDNMLHWCKKRLEEIKTLDHNKKTIVGESQTLQEPGIAMAQNGKQILTQPIDNTDSVQDPEMAIFEEKLLTTQNNLLVLKKYMNIFENNNHSYEIHENMFVNILNLKNDNFMNNVTAATLNAVDLKAFSNNILKLDINAEIDIPLNLETVAVENFNSVNSINGINPQNILHKHEDFHIKHLIVDEDVVFNDNLDVRGDVEGFKFIESEILLNDGNQIFNHNLTSKRLNVGNLLSNNFVLPIQKKTDEETGTMNILNVKNITIDGTVNGINIATFANFVLKTHGDQNITAEYTFDDLQIEDLNTSVLSDKHIPDDLIYINRMDQRIEHDVEFANDVNINNLIVNKRLNNINVFNGKLDVLLKDSADTQFVNGYKLFENIELTNRLKLRGKIHNNLLEKLKPITIFDEELIINDNVTISGNVTLEKGFSTNDILTTRGTYSVKRLEKDGLKLFENIPMPLNFSQQLNIDELFVDKINNIDVDSWIHNKENEKQIIKGKKHFNKDVHITGDVYITKLNGMNLTDLYNNVLNVNGNQTIFGKHHFKDMTAEQIQANRTYFSNQIWENVTTPEKYKQNSGSMVINKNIKAKSINVANLILHENFNGINFENLINDTVFKEQHAEIDGDKYFTNLTVVNAQIERGVNFKALPNSLNSTHSIDDTIELPFDTVMKSIHFTESINDIPYEEFMTKRSNCHNLVIDGEYTFKRITNYKNTFLNTDLLNGLNLTEISEKSLKTYESFEFDSVTFENVISHQPIKVTGAIMDIDLENIITNTEQQTIEKKIFNENVSVNGFLTFTNLVNGVNISELCAFAFPLQHEEASKELVVNGNAYFAKGIRISNINSHDINNILEQAWLLNKNTTLYGHLDFRKIDFNQVELHGYVNNIDLIALNQTYFSKSRDQTVKAILDFTDGIVFQNLQAKEAIVKTVYNIDINDFLRNAILNSKEQVFEMPLLLENCNVLDLQGQFALNNLDVLNDFMRYNGENIVTGLKIIRNVHADKLNINRNYNVNNVDLLKWIYGSILNEGNFNFDYEILFNNVTTFNNQLGVQGLLNGLLFNRETIFLKSLPQNITGYKNFYSLQNTFNNMKLDGYLNGVNINKLMDELINKYKANKFESPITFNNKLTAANVNMNNLFNGVNVTELLNDLNKFVFVNNYHTTYAKLFDVATEIRNSLKSQAHFIQYYKEVQEFSGNKLMSTFKIDGTISIIGLKSHSNISEINFYVWNKDVNKFVPNTNLPIINIYEDVITLIPINFNKGNSYLYIENYNYTTSEYHGTILHPNNENSVIEKLLYHGSRTRFLEGITLPDNYESCIIAIYYYNEFLHIYCERNETNDLDLHQKLPTKNAKTATSITINGDLYLIVTNTAKEQEESCVDVWKFNKTNRTFVLHDVIYVVGPRSISTVSYNGMNYLAIASGYVRYTMYSGLLDIRRFNNDTQKFITWQELKIRAPTEVQFSVLPSDELLLYVLTKDPTEPLKTFIYQGIFGFTEKVATTTTMKLCKIIPFNTIENKHFILTHNKDLQKHTIIEGIFKGQKYII